MVGKALTALAALLVAASAVAGARADTSLVVGFSDDRPKWEGERATAPARSLGAGAFRLTVRWDGAQGSPNGTQVAELDQALGASAGLRVVLAVVGTASTAPQNDTAREAYCTFARSLLERYPSVNDVIVWGEPNKSMFWQPQFNADGSSAAPAAYAALAARCWSVLHAFRADVNVLGPALSPNGNDVPGAASNVSHSPGNFIRKLGDAYRAAGYAQPLFDTIAHHAYGPTAGERPWRQHIGSKIIAQGDWNKLMYNLWLAFDGTAQPIPGECTASRCTELWYTEAGYETRVDDAKASLYTGAEVEPSVIADFAGGEPDAPAPAETSTAPDQATQVLDGVRLAYCQPYVGAFFNFLLWDESRLEGWQSGAFWADLTPKDSFPAFQQAFAEANGDTVACTALKGGAASGDYFPPAAPSSVSAEVVRDPLRAVLSWSAAADNVGTTSYRVYRNGAQIATTTATTLTNSVADSTTYSYTVRALDDAGNMGDASAAVSVTTPDLTAPTVPSGLTATAAAPTRIDLAWAASTDKIGVAGYHVYRDGVYVASTGVPGYADTTVYGGTTYSYAVAAYDAAGNVSAATPLVSATTPPTSQSYAPSSFSIVAGTVAAGSLASLAADDGGRLDVSAVRSGSTYVADVVVEATVARTSRLTVEHDGAASSAGASVTLSVYDWRTAVWTTVDGPRFATTADRAFSWTTAATADYVSPTGAVRFRIRATQGNKRAFVLRTDLVRFTATY